MTVSFLIRFFWLDQLDWSSNDRNIKAAGKVFGKTKKKKRETRKVRHGNGSTTQAICSAGG
jgi:hypothetical protein